MTNWNFADAWEAIAARVPDWPCLIQGERIVAWGEVDRRADALAADLLDAGLQQQAKVLAYLYNAPEYLETYFAAFKAGLVPVNTNYRYGAEEIVYLFDNADAEVVVFHAAFTDLLDGVRERLPGVRRWYVVADETGRGPGWAVSYDDVVGSAEDVGASGSDAEAAHVRGPWGRSGDDLLILYTGGTTGMPKGVMWRQDDLFNVLGAGGQPLLGVPPAESVAELVSRVDPAGFHATMLAACPLMHGTGQFSSLIALNLAGTVAVLPSRHLDIGELWSQVERHGINSVVIVGQAFAGPMLAYLDEHPGEHDLSTVFLISSSGVMWSQENKDGLLRHLPQVALFDSYGSSEAVGLGGSVSTNGHAEQTAHFELGENCAVFTEDGRRVEAGSGEQGMVAISGFIPLGYYKDEAKTAQTFRTFEGRRWSVPGDWAEVDADGSLRLLGRGSVCINTGGEKVFPEEVEEVLKTHASVRDAVCVGVPDDRFGESICAVVEPEPGSDPTAADLPAHVKASLASFKAPRHVVVVDTIGRAPNGKVDYKALKRLAEDRLAGAAAG
ncbi:MAG TPA: acyl-CoA synthetase [Acidimicrobiales bacterium]